MKVLLLTRYGSQGASSRMRSYQYVEGLNSAGIFLFKSPLFHDSLLLEKYRHGAYKTTHLLYAFFRRIKVLLCSNQFDLIWIEKEALPWFPASFEKWLLRKTAYVLDFDDAIFHNYDLHRSAIVRWLYGKRIDTLMSSSRLIIAGNDYLAQRARSAGAKNVAVIPTVVDLARYTPKPQHSATSKARIVWIGSPSTTQYLQDLAQPLATLAQRQPFILRVIGGTALQMPGVEIESLAWAAETEAAMISECEVGIMPLPNTPWAHGKCAYKIIQYMACGLPVVASPVGANHDVVIQGENGYFADGHASWVNYLESLLSDENLRQKLGEAGRARVENEYCLQRVESKLEKLLLEANIK